MGFGTHAGGAGRDTADVVADVGAAVGEEAVLSDVVKAGEALEPVALSADEVLVGAGEGGLEVQAPSALAPAISRTARRPMRRGVSITRWFLGYI